MKFDLRDLDQSMLDAMAQHYEEHGFFLVSGLQESVTQHFRPVMARAMGVDDAQLSALLEPTRPAASFSREVRQQLAQANTTPELSDALLRALDPMLNRLIGPLVHVSSTFHVQYKGGMVRPVDHGGYGPDSEFMEVYGQYLLHQDFTGATIPTSPSAVTLWVAMNTCPEWNIRLYPGSHRRGMLCNQWLDLDDGRVEALGDPVDVAAVEGTAVVFNAMLLHGTSNPGPLLRASCDIRFFPLCGFLPSEVHILDAGAASAARPSHRLSGGPTLQAPALETAVFLGEDVRLADVPRCSVLNWVNYVAHMVRGELDEALPHLGRFVNTDIGVDPLEPYADKFHGRPLCTSNLLAVRERLGLSAPLASAGRS